MSFLDKILGRKNKQIIPEPEHELMKSPSDEQTATQNTYQPPADDERKEITNNKDSPT